MKTSEQVNALTGKNYHFGLDLNRDFYSHQIIGSIDAPFFTPIGCTQESVITHIPDLNGRYVIGGIVHREV